MIAIPRDKVAVLQALASTVNRVSRILFLVFNSAHNTFNTCTSLVFTVICNNACPLLLQPLAEYSWFSTCGGPVAHYSL